MSESKPPAPTPAVDVSDDSSPPIPIVLTAGLASPGLSSDGSSKGSPPSLREASRGSGGLSMRSRGTRRGSDLVQVANAANRSSANDRREQRRKARWSRTPQELRAGGRFAHVEELERQLVTSCVLDEEEEEESANDSSERSSGALAAMEMSGFLVKKTGAFSKQNRRFFVLKGGTLLW